MNFSRKMWGSIVTLGLCAAAFVSVAQPVAGQAAPAQKAGPSERMLNYYNGDEPEYLDPAMATGNIEHNILMNLFEGLTTYDPKTAAAIPAGAIGWKVSPDNFVYTFNLRKNAKWSDGTPVTAKDYEYAWKRALAPATASKAAYNLYVLKNGEAYNQGKIKDPNQVGVKALDDYTLQMTLQYVAPYLPQFLGNNAFAPVKKSVVEKFGDKWTLPANIVSNGPYLLKSWTPLKEVILAKNPGYWDKDNVKVASVKFFPLQDRETGIKMYDNKELDLVWQLPGIRIPDLKKRPDFLTFPTNAIYYFELNTLKPPFNNPKVRRALSMAIDRKAITQFIMQGGEIPTGTIVPPGIMPGYKSVYEIPFDPVKAKQILAEAGYADPSKLPPIEITYNTDQNHKRVAEAIQQMWKRYLGINVTLRNMEWKSYLKARNVGDFQVARAGWIGDYMDPFTFLEIFKTGSSTNYSHWSNKAFDDLLIKANMESDLAKRALLLAQAEKILLEEAPVIPTHVYADTYLVNPKLKGLYGNPLDYHPLKFMTLEP